VHTRQTKRQPGPGRRRSATTSPVQAIFPHRHPRLGRSSIRRTPTSIERSKAFAGLLKCGAAAPPRSRHRSQCCRRRSSRHRCRICCGRAAASPPARSRNRTPNSSIQFGDLCHTLAAGCNSPGCPIPDRSDELSLRCAIVRPVGSCGLRAVRPENDAAAVLEYKPPPLRAIAAFAMISTFG
jgi:hypothetical protein